MNGISQSSSSYESVDLVRVGVEMHEAAIQLAAAMLLVFMLTVGTCVFITYLCARYIDAHTFKQSSSVLHVGLADGRGFADPPPAARDAFSHRLRSEGWESPSHANDTSFLPNEPVFDASSSPTRNGSATQSGELPRSSTQHLTVRRVN